MQTLSHSKMKYVITFIDDFSRKTTIYFLFEKSQVLDKFKIYKALVENQSQKKIRKLRSDNGGEYVSKEWSEFCNTHGIARELTAPYTPQQNGVSERKNRTLVESARCMLHLSKLPNKFWAEAISTACYLQNRSAHSALGNKTPEEMWAGIKPSLKHIRTFGCDAYVHIPKEIRQKLDSKSKVCKLLGYSETTKGYRLFDPKSNKIITSRDVIFNEKIPLPKSQNLDITLDKDFHHVSGGSTTLIFQGNQINNVPPSPPPLPLPLQPSTPIPSTP